MISLLVVVPLIFVLLSNLPLNRKMMNLFAFFSGIGLCLLQMLLAVFMPSSFWNSSHGFIDKIFPSALAMDNLSRVMILSIAIVLWVSFFVSKYILKSYEKIFLSSNLFLIILGGLNGVVLAGDLFTLYVFLEVTAVCSFVLIAANRSIAGFEGAFKYLIQSAVATALLLISISIFMLYTGNLSFSEISLALSTSQDNSLIKLAVSFLLVALFIKGGLFPFHGWLPDAYGSAPYAVSVLLAGIVTKTTGIYTLIRLSVELNLFSTGSFGIQVQTIAGFIALISILFAAFAAYVQKDLKRLLAYSSISQVGYIVLGLSAGNPLGFVGAVFHLFNHSIFKSLLFVNTAVVETESGSTNFHGMGGFSDKMPVTGISSAIAVLSVAGIPPFSGFWSKLIIILALWQAGLVTYAVIAVLASIFTLAYLLMLQRTVFFGKISESHSDIKDGNAWALVPSIVLALITLVVGVAFPWLFETFLLPIRSFL